MKWCDQIPWSLVFECWVKPVSVQFSSVAQSCPTLCDPMNRSMPGSLSITNSSSLLKLMSFESVMPSNHLIPFSSCLQSFPASGSFPMSQLFSSGIGASALVLPMNIQGWFPLGLTGLISLQSKGLSRVFPTPQIKSISSSALSFLYSSTHIHTWLLEEP